jgi:hypothetical protein
VPTTVTLARAISSPVQNAWRAAATVAALELGRRGIYNITDDEPSRVAEWLPFLADTPGVKPPLRLPVSLGRDLVDLRTYP